MTTNRQRKAKLRSRLALLRCKCRIVANPQGHIRRIENLLEEALRFENMAQRACAELDEYISSFPAMQREMRKCKRLLQLIERHPDADYSVLLYRAERECD